MRGQRGIYNKSVIPLSESHGTVRRFAESHDRLVISILDSHEKQSNIYQFHERTGRVLS